jgi:hypothetical protein
MISRIVTKENVKIGMKVRRGKDWSWGNQDYSKGKPTIGTVTKILENSWVKVLWSNGSAFCYRVGTRMGFAKEEKYDLYMTDEASSQLEFQFLPS